MTEAMAASIGIVVMFNLLMTAMFVGIQLDVFHDVDGDCYYYQGIWAAIRVVMGLVLFGLMVRIYPSLDLPVVALLATIEDCIIAFVIQAITREIKRNDAV